MILIKRDDDKKVIAYVDYDIVDMCGKNCIDGIYAFIRYMWVHESIRNNRLIRYFIKEALIRHKQLKYIYYNRFKYNDRLRMYNIREI